MNIKIIAYPTGDCNANQSNPLFAAKPQIVSIPGVSPKQRNRYRVVLGEKLLGDRLTLDEALKLANGGEA